MDISNERLPELVAVADHAYRRARAEVFDRLPPVTRVDPERLSPIQLDAITHLVVAEAELANYRRRRLEPIRLDELVGAWSR